MKKDIRSLEEIPFEKDLVATGRVNRIVWFWRVPGKFVRNGEVIFFVDAHGVAQSNPVAGPDLHQIGHQGDDVRLRNRLPMPDRKRAILVRLRDEFGNTRKLHLPMQSIVRVEEVERKGQSAIRDATTGEKVVTPFPLPANPKR